MIARIPLLAGILLVQLLILGLLLLSGGPDESAAELLSFDASEVRTLSIEDAEGNSLSVSSVDGGWRLDELPADGAKVTGVIESLAGGSASWPVATSESAQSRFEVAEDVFQRKVTFAGEDGELATLYLGSSPGFRRIHAREADEAAIFSIDFGVHELPTDRSDWLDKQLFRVESVRSVTFPEGAVLASDEAGDWTVDGQVADVEAATRFADRIRNLPVLGFYEALPDSTLGEPVTVLVQDNLGTHNLTLRFNEAVDEYVLESDRLPGAFTVASYIVEQILVPPGELLASADSEPAGAAAEAEAAAAPASGEADDG